MRKRDPDAVVDTFNATVTSQRDHAKSLASAASLGTGRRVYEDALMRLAVSWEVFRSDWFIACINRDSSAMAAVVQTAVNKQVQKANRGPAFGALKKQWIQVNVPAHPTLEDIAKVLDPSNYNLELPRDIRQDGGLLAAPYAARVAALTEDDNKLVAAVNTLRNALAHQSTSSIDRMNTSIDELSATSDPGLKLSAAARRVTVAGIGRYLGAEVANGGQPPTQARCLHFHDRMRGIAAKLR